MELVRLLARHPQTDLVVVVSHSSHGNELRKVLPAHRSTTIVFEADDSEQLADRCQVVFLAQENGESSKRAPLLLERGCRVIDLAGDFRLKSGGDFAFWYKLPEPPAGVLAEAVYGVPELFREQLKGARLVANPGCYPTAALLGLVPLVRAGLITSDTVIIDGKSGVSGAGRSQLVTEFLFSEVNESLKPYGVGGVHRHTPEIEQGLGGAMRVLFTPHLVPMSRGLLTTAYVVPRPGVTVRELRAALEEGYQGEPFVRVLPEGQLPSTKALAGSNGCDIQVVGDERSGRAIVLAAIDNLGKGAAGQAVQNMNRLCGLDETLGLHQDGVWP